MRSIRFVNSLNQEITLDLITAVEGIGIPDTIIQEQKSPYQNGSTWIDTLFDTRQIKVDCAMIDLPVLADRDARKDELMTVLNPRLGPGTLYYTNDSGTRVIVAGTENSPYFPNKPYTEPYQKYQVYFRCFNPLFREENQNQIELSTEVGLFEVPDGSGGWEVTASGYEFGLDSSTPVTILNDGQYKAPIQVTFYGPATNPKIENQTSGKYIKINKTLVLGDVVMIDTTFGQKSVLITNGGVTTNGMAYLDLASEFWELEQGNNLVRFTDDVGTATAQASVAFYKLYLGV